MCFIFQIILLYPIYDRCNRIGGRRWRLISIASSFVGIVLTLGVLLLSIPALHILDKIVAPFIISFSTILEITAFVFIYGKNITFGCKHLVCELSDEFWLQLSKNVNLIKFVVCTKILCLSLSKKFRYKSRFNLNLPLYSKSKFVLSVSVIE